MILTKDALSWIIPLGVIAFIAPNVPEIAQKRFSKEFFQNFQISNKFTWKPSAAWAIVMSLITIYAVMNLISGAEQFLYYQF